MCQLEMQTAVVTLTAQDTAYLFEVPKGVESLKIQCRDATALRIGKDATAVALGAAGGNYFTVKSGTVYDAQDVDPRANMGIQIACGVAGKYAEIVYWQRVP